MIEILRDKKGASLIDACIIVLAIAMVIALVVKVIPVFIEKQQLNTFATELCRTAEIAGGVGSAAMLYSGRGYRYLSNSYLAYHLIISNQVKSYKVQMYNLFFMYFRLS